MTTAGQPARRRLRQSLPWLVLSGALAIATMPAWRPWLFGVRPDIEDLLALRCLPR